MPHHVHAAAQQIGDDQRLTLREAIDQSNENRAESWVSVIPVKDTPTRLSVGHINAVVAGRSDVGGLVIGLEDLLASLKSKLDRGIPVKANFSHKKDPAAGAVLDGKIEDGALWNLVRWTPNGGQAIIDGEYDFTSAEARWTNGKDPSGPDGPEYMGFALTNDPAFTGQVPITVSAGSRYELDIAAALELDDGESLDGLVGDIRSAVMRAGRMGIFGGTEGWAEVMMRGIEEDTVKVALEPNDGTDSTFWLVTWARGDEKNILLTEPLSARMVFVTDETQASLSSVTATAQGADMTLEELKASLADNPDALAALDALEADKVSAEEAKAEAETERDTAVAAQAPAGDDEVMAKLNSLSIDLEAVKAKNETLQAAADTAQLAEFELYCESKGVPADLKASAKMFYDHGGMESVKEQTLLWATAGRLVPVGAARTSRDLAPGEASTSDPRAAAFAKFDEIYARDGVNNRTEARRILAREDKDAHAIVAAGIGA